MVRSGRPFARTFSLFGEAEACGSPITGAMVGKRLHRSVFEVLQSSEPVRNPKNADGGICHSAPSPSSPPGPLPESDASPSSWISKPRPASGFSKPSFFSKNGTLAERLEALQRTVGELRLPPDGPKPVSMKGQTDTGPNPPTSEAAKAKPPGQAAALEDDELRAQMQEAKDPKGGGSAGGVSITDERQALRRQPMPL
mmetsp:Transcript_18357/g.51450  ORF Transcript_18357/g.51450 Transcript_18357/m.51450 type:complete len:198 (-) Transcript_18357:156-749(-)